MSRQKKKAPGKRKTPATKKKLFTAKEKSSRQKKITHGKKKKIAVKEKLLQQKKVTHRKKEANTTKGHEKNISKNKILKKEKKIFCKFF